MIWDFCKTSGIIRITPVVLWHKDKGLLEFGWFDRAFLILLDKSKHI